MAFSSDFSNVSQGQPDVRVADSQPDTTTSSFAGGAALVRGVAFRIWSRVWARYWVRTKYLAVSGCCHNVKMRAPPGGVSSGWYPGKCQERPSMPDRFPRLVS